MSLEEVLQRSKIKCVLGESSILYTRMARRVFSVYHYPPYRLDSDCSLKDLYKPVKQMVFKATPLIFAHPFS